MKATKKVNSINSVRQVFRLKVSFVAIAACFMPMAYANPVGPVVVSGAATIATQGNTLSVTNTPGAILNWQQFNIGQGQTTQFNQQSAQSSVLNRVVGLDASQILGTLRSNGNVFLINPNGIMFGVGSVIDVNALIASTLNITNANFLANNLKFDGSNGTSVLNQGQITTPMGGSVYLIGNDVSNQGIITTPQGQVLLAAGNSVSLVDAFTPNVSVTVSAPAGGQALNLGQINAQGGSIDIYGALVKQQGLVNASSASVDGQGNVVLSASQAVDVAVGSVTSVVNSAGQGGGVQILAPQVTVAGSVDASGRDGGGTVLVGGDYQGKNPAVPNALTTVVSNSASLKADATGAGDGGKVIVWANDSTKVHGSVSARGGYAGGNGGLIETSGHVLDVSGISVNASAPKGAAGSWLLDPIDVTVSSVDGNGVFDLNGTWTPSATGSTVANTTIETALNAGTNVTITTAGGLSEPGNITVSAPIAATGTTLTILNLQADNKININSPITVTAGTLMLASPTLAVNDNLRASVIALYADSPITVASGKTVVASNGATTNPMGTLFLGNYALSGAVTVGSGGLANGADISSLAAGSGKFQASAVDVWSESTLTVNTAPLGLNLINLRAPTLVINDDVTAKAIGLFTDNAITVAAGKTVIASNGAATNPSGMLSFRNYPDSNAMAQHDMTVGGGWLNLNQISNYGGSGAFQTSSLGLYGDSTLTVNTALSWAGPLTLQAPTVNISSGASVNVMGAGNINFWASGLTNSGTLSGSGIIHTGGSLTDFTNNGTLNPGGVGVTDSLMVDGNMHMGTGSILNMELGGTGVGQFDRVLVNGNLSMAGVVNASLLSGYTPIHADAASFLMASGSKTGTFSTTNLAPAFTVGYNLATGEAARLIYSGGSVTFTNASGGLDWATPGNWSGGILPGVANDALISSGSGIAVTHASGTDSIAALTISNSNSLNVSGGSLAVSGTTTLDGLLTVSSTGSATLNGALNAGTTSQLAVSGGSLTLNGTSSIPSFNMSGGTLGGSGNVTIGNSFSQSGGLINKTGALTINQASGVLDLGNITADSMTLTSVGDIDVTDSGVYSTGLLTVHGTNLNVTSTNAAAVLSAGSMNIAMSGNIALTGGSSGASKYALINSTNGDQSIMAAGITLTGGAGGGGLSTGNYAEIFGRGNQSVTVGAGGLKLIAGGGSGTGNTDNFSMVLQGGSTNPVAGSTQTITVNNGGSIVMKGGSSVLTSVGSGHGSRALIESDGVSQAINFTNAGAIDLTGGTAGSRAYAEIYTSTGSQTITGAPSITLTGGASGGLISEGNSAGIKAANGTQTIDASAITVTGGAGGTGNEAYVSSSLTQNISVGVGGLTLVGGAGVVSNHATIRQFGATGSQNITINGGGAIDIVGGSSSDITAGTAGSNGDIQANGTGQEFVFAAGGNINMTGGTVGGGNQAFIRSTAGSQWIYGLPSITLTGGANGGVDGEGNAAGIYTNLGLQIIRVRAMTLNAGAGGLANSAYIQGPYQDIVVIGNLALNGGGSSSTATSGGGAGMGWRGGANATSTHLSLDVDGNLTMTGGSVSGSSIGSGYIGGQATDVVISVGGNLTLNPGSVAGVGVRIGTPDSAPGVGNISIWANGAIALNDDSVIRTLGNVALTGASISQTAASKLLAAGLTTVSTTGTGLNGLNNTVAQYLASNTGSGDIKFTNVGVLDVQGLDDASGDIALNNTGGVSTSGAVKAVQGGVSMTANSPLTVGAAGVSASGDVLLAATNLTSSGNLTLNGPVSSTAGSATLTAASNYVQNSAVTAASGVTASAGGSMTFGASATTDGNPVSYTAAGVKVSAPLATVKVTTDPCLMNPTLCVTSTVVAKVVNPVTSTTAPVDSAATAATATGQIIYSAVPVVVAAPVAIAYQAVVGARVEARQADAAVQQAQESATLAVTPQEQVVAIALVAAKALEADAKRADAKILEAGTELHAAEVEVKTAESPQAKLRAESRQSVAQAKRAEGEVDKVEAQERAAEAEVRHASTPEAKATAQAKLEEAKVNKAQIEAVKAEVDVRKAETEVRQAEAEVKVSNDPHAKAVLEVKKVEVESKKAAAEVKQAQAEVAVAKAPAEKAKAEEKVAVAEVRRADADARKADVEAGQAQAKARASDSPVEQHVAATKTAQAQAKKADVEVKQAELAVATAKTPEAKQKAQVQQAHAEVKKADREVEKAETEVKLAQTIASTSKSTGAAQEVETKKAEVEVKKADAELAKARVEVKTAKAPGEKDTAQVKQQMAEVKKAQAELKQVEHEAKVAQEDAKTTKSAFLKDAVQKSAVASEAKLEAKKAEVEVKKGLAEVKQAEMEVKSAKTPEARGKAEKQLQAKQEEAQAKEQKVATLKADADSKEADAQLAKRRSENKIVEAFGGMSVATLGKPQMAELLAARHEFMKGSLSPALSFLKSEPDAADLKPCGAGSGDVCIKPPLPTPVATLSNVIQPILARVQLALRTPLISFLPRIQRKVAVVIGNNAYQDPKIPSLDGAIKDADAIGDVFKDKMGYEVRMVHNGTRADIVRALNKVADETGSSDSVVVYYAGHGYQMEDTKVGYWIPSDASVKSPDNWISNSDINKILATIPAKQMIVMSDSCYSGALTNEQRVTAAASASNVQDILDKRSVLVMSSGGEEPVLDEGRDGHSIFAWHLMDKLNHVDQYKDGFEVFNAVKTSVAQEGIPQTPQYGASISAGHKIGGEYLFEVRKY